MKTKNLPKVGQTIQIRGFIGIIRKIRDFGTLDVELQNGKYVRITGLSF